MEKEPQLSLAALLRQAKEALRERQYDRTLQYARKVLQRDRDNYFAYVFVGAAAAGLGERERALQAYQRATALRPADLLAWRGLCESAAEATGSESDAYWNAVIAGCDRCLEAELEVQNERVIAQLLRHRWRALSVLSERTPLTCSFEELDCKRLQALFEYEHRDPSVPEWMTIARCARMSTAHGLRSLWKWIQRVALTAWQQEPALLSSYIDVSIRMWQCASERALLFQEWIIGAERGDLICLSVLGELLAEDTAPSDLVENRLFWSQCIAHRMPYEQCVIGAGWVLIQLASVRHDPTEDERRFPKSFSGPREDTPRTWSAHHSLSMSLLQIGLGMRLHHWNDVIRSSGIALDLIGMLRKQGRELSFLESSIQLALGIAQRAQGSSNEALLTLEAALEALHGPSRSADTKHWAERIRCCIWRILAECFWQQSEPESRKRALSFCAQILAVDEHEPWALLQRMEWTDEQASARLRPQAQTTACTCVDWLGHWRELRHIKDLFTRLDNRTMPLGLALIDWGNRVAASSRVRALAFLSRARHRRLLVHPAFRMNSDSEDVSGSELDDLVAAIEADPHVTAAYWALARSLWNEALELGGPYPDTEQGLRETSTSSVAAMRGAPGPSVLLHSVRSAFGRLDSPIQSTNETAIEAANVSGAHESEGESHKEPHLATPECEAGDNAMQPPRLPTSPPMLSSPTEKLTQSTKDVPMSSSQNLGQNGIEASSLTPDGGYRDADTKGRSKSSSDEACISSESHRDRDGTPMQERRGASARESAASKASWYWYMAMRCLERAHLLEPSHQGICLKLMRAYAWEMHRCIRQKDSGGIRSAVCRIERICLEAIAASTGPLPWAWFTLGWFQFECRSWSECVLSLQKYVQMEDRSAFRDKRHLLSWYALGEAYRRQGKVLAAGQALARSWQYSSLMSAAMRGCSIGVIVLVGTAYARVLTAQGQHTEALELVLQLSNWLGERHPSKEANEGIRHQWDTFADAEASTATASLGVSEPSARVAREPIPDESPVRSSSAHDFRARQEMVPFGDDPLPGHTEPDRPSVVPRESGSMHATSYPRSAQWLDALVYSGLAQVRDSRAERLWLLGRRQAATQDWKMAMLELERACAALPAAAAEELRSRFLIIALKLLQRVGPASLHGIFSRTSADTALVGIEHGRDHNKVCGRAPEALLTEIVRSLSTMQTLEAGSASHPELSARLLVVELLLLASRATSSPEQGKVDLAAILQRLAELAQTTSGWIRTRIAGAFLASLAFVGFLCYHDVEEWSLLERFGPLDRDTAVVIVALALLNEHHLRRRETSSNAAASPAERVDTTLLGRGLDWLHVHHADSALGATLMGLVYERLVGDVVMADRFYELGVHLHPSEPLAQLQAIRARLRRTRQAETTTQPAEWMQYAFYWQQVRKSGILWSREWCGGQNQNPSANIMDADAEDEVCSQLDAYWLRRIAQIAVEREQRAIECATGLDANIESYQRWLHRYADLMAMNPHQRLWNEQLHECQAFNRRLQS